MSHNRGVPTFKRSNLPSRVAIPRASRTNYFFPMLCHTANATQSVETNMIGQTTKTCGQHMMIPKKILLL